MQPSQNQFTNQASLIRTNIKDIGKSVLLLKTLTIQMEDPDKMTSLTDKSEMIANAMLAYRHLEDAAMRMGKFIQAFETGNSIYDQNDSLRAANIKV